MRAESRRQMPNLDHFSDSGRAHLMPKAVDDILLLNLENWATAREARWLDIVGSALMDPAFAPAAGTAEVSSWKMRECLKISS